MKRQYVFLPLIITLALVACAQPPKAEIDAAEAAFAKAQSSPDVAAYAPEALARAERAISVMRDEVAAKHYDKAKAAAIDAKTAAENAVAMAVEGKDRAKAKAEETIAAAKKAEPETVKLLADAAKVKKAKLDLAVLNDALKAAQASLADADGAFAKSDYLIANDKAASAQKAFADIQAAIATSVQGATRKK
jgi:hypothetical protein